MKHSLLLALSTSILAISTTGSACADELVITLHNGRTIVLDTAQIRSMTFSKTDPQDTIRLVPSPKNFSPEARPPGVVSATVRPVRGRAGNLAVSVTMTKVLPNHRYQVFLFVSGRNHGQPTPIFTDRTGFGHCAGEFQLPPGEHVIGLSITHHDADDDIYVTPGIYENQGCPVSIPRP